MRYQRVNLNECRKSLSTFMRLPLYPQGSKPQYNQGSKMNKWISLLLLLLSVSIAFNFYLFSFYLLSSSPKQNQLALSEEINEKVKQNTTSETLFNWNFRNQSTQDANANPAITNQLAQSVPKPNRQLL